MGYCFRCMHVCAGCARRCGRTCTRMMSDVWESVCVCVCAFIAYVCVTVCVGVCKCVCVPRPAPLSLCPSSTVKPRRAPSISPRIPLPTTTFTSLSHPHHPRSRTKLPPQEIHVSPPWDATPPHRLPENIVRPLSESMPDTGAASAAGTATDGAAEGSRHRHRSQGEGEKHESHAGPPPSTSGVLGESSSVLRPPPPRR